MASKLAASLMCIGCFALIALGQSLANFQGTIYRVDRSTVAKSVPEPSIIGFDVSPDGTLLSLLVKSGSTKQSQLWLLVEKIGTDIVVKRIQLASLEWAFRGGYAPQLPHVRFTSDGKLLVVQDLQKVQVLETENYSLVHTIAPRTDDVLNVPVSILGGSESGIFAISFGTGLGPDEAGRQTVRVEIVDVTTGRHLAEWGASDIPQSLSPMGKLVAISDWSSPRTLLPLQIIDAITGKKVTTLNGGYGFGRVRRDPGRDPEVVGSVIGRFLSEDEILLNPGEGSDDSGHYAGKSLKLVRISDGKTLKEFKPPRYGPSEEMAISANRKTFVAISDYLSPYTLSHDVALPDDSGPRLLTLSFERDRIELTSNHRSRSGLDISSQPNMQGPSISSDGTVTAIALDGGITIFERRAGK